MPSKIEQDLASSNDSLISGGLAGILAASVFGGPIGAAVGVGAGLLSQRMKRNELDLLTDNYKAVQTYGSSVQDQLKTTKAYLDKISASGEYDATSDYQQLDSMQREAARAQDLAQHYDPQIRTAGVGQLTNVGSRFDAFHSDIEQRTRGLADRQYALEKETRDHYQTQYDTVSSSLREMNSLANSTMEMVKNDPTISHPQTKAALMQLQGISQREADQDAMSFSVGLLGTGLGAEINDFSPDYDQAVKIIESVRHNQIAAASDYLTKLHDTALKQGYTFAQESDGKVTVKTINSIIEDFRQAPAPGSPTAAVPPTPPVGSDPQHLSGGKYPTADRIAGAVNKLPEDISKGLGDIQQSTKQAWDSWQNNISETMRRKRMQSKKRKTNQ